MTAPLSLAEAAEKTDEPEVIHLLCTQCPTTPLRAICGEDLGPHDDVTGTAGEALPECPPCRKLWSLHLDLSHT